MPTYDYMCENCGHRFEKFHSITAAALRQCPKCSKDQLKRLIGSGSGVIFKGSGFYQTDYRTESYKKSEKKETTTTDTTKDKTKTKSKDSKPAAKDKKKFT